MGSDLHQWAIQYSIKPKTSSLNSPRHCGQRQHERSFRSVSSQDGAKASHKIAKDDHGLCGEHHRVRRGGVAAEIWCTLHGRVKNRSAAIHSQEDMESVIQEEWARLAFDRSQYDEDGFIGINALVDM